MGDVPGIDEDEGEEDRLILSGGVQRRKGKRGINLTRG